MECDILDSLEQLGYDGPLLEEKALLKAAGEGLSSPEYVDLCRWLTSRLKPLCGLEESITSGPDDLDSLQVEMSALLRELHCPFEGAVSEVLRGGTQGAKDHLKFVLFLSSELQAAQIVSGRRDSENHREESPVRRELAAICETLKLPEPGGKEAAEVFSELQNKVEHLLQGLPSGSIGKPVLKKPLSSEQWEKLRGINRALSSEYECRRRMLIKRLDVTVQSFGWSDRAKVKVDSMAGAYQPRRHSLRPRPSVDAAELLAAREDICNVVKTSSGSSRQKTACAVNKVLMGRVPDRGGRPSEIQPPPPEMPAWQKRQDGREAGGTKEDRTDTVIMEDTEGREDDTSISSRRDSLVTEPHLDKKKLPRCGSARTRLLSGGGKTLTGRQADNGGPFPSAGFYKPCVDFICSKL